MRHVYMHKGHIHHYIMYRYMYVNIVLFSPPESCEMLVRNNKNKKAASGATDTAAQL